MWENLRMIRFESVSFDYVSSEGPRAALRDVDFRLEPGEFVTLVGPNGSGKSTLARLCDGLLTPSEGRVTVDDMDTTDPESTWVVRSRVGLVLQDPDGQIVGTSVEADAAFGPENLGLEPAEIRGRVDEALATVGLAGFEEREPHLLSEGQKQRLAIAGALTMDPAYLVLDEPTSMLDPDGRASVLELVEGLARERGRGILLVTHRMEEVARSDRVVVLLDGKVVVDGPPDDLLTDRALMGRLSLEPPPLAELISRLRIEGAPVPATAFTPERVVSALWP